LLGLVDTSSDRDRQPIALWMMRSQFRQEWGYGSVMLGVQNERVRMVPSRNEL
jgi:hypothetical protein